MKTLRSLLAAAVAATAFSTLAFAETPAKDAVAPTTTNAATAQTTDSTAATKGCAMNMSKDGTAKAAMPTSGCCSSGCSMKK